MKRFNLQIFRKFWEIAQLYWRGNEKKGAIGLLVVLIALLFIYTPLRVQLNTQRGNLISALSAQDADRFWQNVIIFCVIMVVYVPLFAVFNYLVGKLGLYWRRWLTNTFLDKYLSNRAFYEIGNFNTYIDNPDQRIAQDIRSFTQESLSFFITILVAIFQIVAFSGVLWSISKLLVFFLASYAVVGTLITILGFGKILVKLNFQQLKKEANFRFGLVRIRENAESIAFYQGENQEGKQAKHLFNDLFDNFNELILWERMFLGLFTNSFELIPLILPAIIVGPKVLAGDFEVGKVSEAIGAFSTVFFSLNIIVSRFDFLTGFAAGINRLSGFYEFLEQDKESKYSDARKIDTIENGKLAIQHLTLQTPTPIKQNKLEKKEYQRTLIRDLSFELNSGNGLLIMGASGCGKSSLLRAIAGLWNSGTGIIYRPELAKMLFLPQKPYMILGTLKEQLIYPNVKLNIEDEQLQQILEEVNLPDLAERFGGFDQEKDWGEVLSLGEQQRVAFARILITKPKYAILDEATSALDLPNEQSLYEHLLATNTTFISVGHRQSLRQYHQFLLEITPEEDWNLSEIKA